jgi:hypothetical protein
MPACGTFLACGDVRLESAKRGSLIGYANNGALHGVRCESEKMRANAHATGMLWVIADFP